MGNRRREREEGRLIKGFNRKKASGKIAQLNQVITTGLKMVG